MLQSYLRIIYRNFIRQPGYLLLNLAGLAVGIACCIFIAMFVWDEVKFDKYHQHADQIYRVSQTMSFEGDETRSATTPFPVKDAIVSQFPGQVQYGARFFDMEAENVSIGVEEEERYFREKGFFFVDPEVLNIFDINLLRGNPDDVLAAPNTVIITPKKAERYFGNEDPVGRVLHLEGRVDLTVTGIMEEWPEHSHLRADFFASFESLASLWGNYDQIVAHWAWNPAWTYFLVEPGTDISRLEEQINNHTTPFFTERFGENEEVKLALQPLKEIYLYSDLNYEIGQTGSYIYIIIFSIVGFLILGIACINYINLSTARAAQRSKEVGLRKTMGAFRSQLTGQFLTESAVYAALAVLLSMLFVYLLSPWYGTLTGKELVFAELGALNLFLIITGLLALITLLAGFYPATFLSSYSPVDSVRGTHTKGKKGGRLRRVLVVSQFSVTAVLLIGTSLAYLQYQHMRHMEMGFEQEQVVVIPSSMSYAIWRYDNLKNSLLEHSAIAEVSGSQTVMGSDIFFTHQITPEGYGEQDAHSIAKLFVLEDFLETMGIELLAGRNFSEEYGTDRDQTVLINELMVEKMEWGSPEEALGKTFRYYGKTVSVIGVTENFHFAHLRYDLEPLILELPDNRRQMVANIGYIKVRLNGGNPGPALAQIEKAWDEVDPVNPFEFYFLDNKIEEMYTAELQFSRLMGIFTLLAIFIGCLGLLGLASFSVNKRAKEIGIRKALGATVTGIFYMLSKDYVKLILIAHAIALPAVYLMARYGLEFFPYQINLISYLGVVFVLSLVVSVVISLLTISTHSVKAAMINPVESLKQE